LPEELGASPLNAHTLYQVPAPPSPDHHTQLSLPPADRDHRPQRPTDLCGAVEGLLHERRFESFGHWLSACVTPFVRDLPRSPVLSGRHESSYVGCPQPKERLKRGWWAEEGVEINQDVGGKFEGAGGVVDGLSRIIAHDSWVSPQRLRAVRTGFVQAHHSREQTVDVVDNEHDVLPLFRVSHRHRSEEISERSIPLLPDALNHSGDWFFRNEGVPKYVPQMLSKYA